MSEITTNVNWIATILGAVIAFAMGWLWYSPKLFGKKWAEGVRITLDDKTSPPVMAMVTQAIATFLLAWVVAVTAANDALLTIILITLAFVALIVSGGLFAQKSRYAIATEAGYVVVMVVIMIVCQGVL
ncbi:MAG: DUF1761 domain-containing protein [Lysobacterales bacterium]|nr:MAG: DUF1761 domain-containing protein [Xanthomonadales bacterium]